MTMPHLSNCPHNGEGWCLECVKKLWEEKEMLTLYLEVALAQLKGNKSQDFSTSKVIRCPCNT